MQNTESNLTELVTLIDELAPNSTPEDIGDMLWLSYQIHRVNGKDDTPIEPLIDDVEQHRPQPREQPSTSQPKQNDSPPPPPIEIPDQPIMGNKLQPDISDKYNMGLYTGIEGGHVGSGMTLETPSVPVLPDALTIMRRLRPLKKMVPSNYRMMLDEDKTVQHSAEAELLLPIRKPAAERWLDVVLLCDQSPSMVIWDELIDEFRHLLEKVGAFRQIDCWAVRVSEASNELVVYSSHKRSTHHRHHWRTLIDPSRRRLIVVVSDCIAAYWSDGRMANKLEAVSKYNTIAVLQMLPNPLWMRTGIDDAELVGVRTTTPLCPNHLLEPQPIKLSQGVLLPIITLEPELLSPWVKTMRYGNDAWIAGMLLPLQPPQPVADSPNPNENNATHTADELVDIFFATASPEAQDLAIYLSAMPLTLPVMRLVQEKVLTNQRQVHLAEFFLSGLIKQLPTEDPNDLQYEFVDGVRDLLLNEVRISEVTEMRKKISGYIKDHLGNTMTFLSWLGMPAQTGDMEILDSHIPFAHVEVQVLRRLGREYARLADELETKIRPPLVPRIPQDLSLVDLYQQYLNGEPLDLSFLSENQLVIYDEVRQKIVYALQRGSLDHAQAWVDFAWAIAYDTEDDDHIAHANWCSAIFYSGHKTRRAVDHQKKAIDHFRRTNQTFNEGRVMIGYASQIAFLGELEVAEKAINRAIVCLSPWPNYNDWPTIYLTQSQIYLQQGRYQEAIEATRVAENVTITFSENYPNESVYYTIYRAEALLNRGRAAMLNYDVQLAYDSLNHALVLAETHNAVEIAGRSRINMGRLYTLQDKLFEALKLFAHARENFESTGVQVPLATILLYEADLYQRLMMPLHARNAAIKAAQVFKGEGIVSESVDAYLVSIDIALNSNERKRARHYLQDSESIVQHAPQHLQLLWQSYNAHPMLQRAEQQYQEALKTVDEASAKLTELGSIQYALKTRLIAASLAIELEEVDAFERYESIMNDAHRHGFTHLEQDACIQLARYQPPKDAQGTLRRAADILVQTRQQMPVAELKANLWTGQADIYVQLIEAQFECDQLLDATQTLIEAKGGLWIDFTRSKPESTINEKWIRTRAELAHWEDELRQVIQQNNPEHLPYQKICRKHIEQAKNTLAIASRTLSRNQTSTDVILSSLPTIADIQAQLQAAQNHQTSSQSIILEYFVGTEQVYVCVIPPVGDTQWISLGKIADIKNLMTRFEMLIVAIMRTGNSYKREQILSEQKITIDKVLFDLYQNLIEPIEHVIHKSSINKLMIVPDQFLFSIPWAALYNNESYLSDQYQIILYPSSVLLVLSAAQHTQKLNAATSQQSLILGHVGEPPLRHLQQELSQITQILPNATKISSAQIADFVWAEPPLCIHIGAHAWVDLNAPLFSRIDLADESLFLADILNFDLEATDLVTLSASETGVIPELGGVTLSLAGAFLVAGAKTVLSNLWPVDDQSTCLLMTQFYQEWNKTHDVADSLQAAQAHVRANGYDHPFFWAAFQALSR
ncbi:MAG: CHAT domain-containing tetratricopeptide repeat protein [Chloroflexota bacterium]